MKIKNPNLASVIRDLVSHDINDKISTKITVETARILRGKAPNKMFDVILIKLWRQMYNKVNAVRDKIEIEQKEQKST